MKENRVHIMKSKIYLTILMAGLSGIMVAQQPQQPQQPKKVAPSVAKTTAPIMATPTENETLRLQNFGLQYTLAKKQVDDDNKSLNDIGTAGMGYVNSLETKYNAKYNPNTGQFVINTPAKK